MKSLFYRTLTLIFFIACLYSCKKGDINGFIPPEDTIPILPPGPPPTAISFETADLGSVVTLSFDYNSTPNKIQVYLDDPASTDPYDQLAVVYSFVDGYLEKTEYYATDGTPAGGFTIQRSGSLISGAIMEHLNEMDGSLIKDTLHISFSDFGGLKNMYVDYGNYFDPDVPVSIKYTFKDKELKEAKAGLYENNGHSLYFPSYKFSYNNSTGSLWQRESDTYYGTSFIYGDAGKGLDSLFILLGGKDGHLLEAITYYDQYIGLYFYPLQIALNDNSVELDAIIHRCGALQQVKSIPNGIEYPITQTFTFQNVFDEEKRLVKSTVMSNALLYGVYKVQY
ncbi:MAG: hypothetical protein KF746_02205 [Chitinophagaceae bacterium]|nr:hypothetical protein [Chitinophagaceae bacterium]